MALQYTSCMVNDKVAIAKVTVNIVKKCHRSILLAGGRTGWVNAGQDGFSFKRTTKQAEISSTLSSSLSKPKCSLCNECISLCMSVIYRELAVLVSLHLGQISDLKWKQSLRPGSLASQQKSALIDERSGGYNEALADSACEMSNLNDIIYQGGYKFGLTCADILTDYELFSQPALCLPDFYTTTISSDSKEECESDEASFNAPLPEA
ncbi:hypothetical protein LguiA_011989 [Lonicera macranthoides]